MKPINGDLLTLTQHSAQRLCTCAGKRVHQGQGEGLGRLWDVQGINSSGKSLIPGSVWLMIILYPRDTGSNELHGVVHFSHAEPAVGGGWTIRNRRESGQFWLLSECEKQWHSSWVWCRKSLSRAYGMHFITIDSITKIPNYSCFGYCNSKVR